jgi:predicted P-loop ATPase
MSAENLTALVSVSGKYATKQFSPKPGGGIKNRGYGNETFFSVASVPVANIQELGCALEQVALNPFAFVVRGEPLPAINRKHTRRLAYADKKTGDPAAFGEQPRHAFIVDVDHVACPATIDPISDPDGAIEYVLGLLPPDLWDATVWWQFSSSQSVTSVDTLSVHLWFWSAEPLSNAELKRWGAVVNKVAGYKLVDTSLYSAVQPHYVAAPIFNGINDPLPRRCGLRQGLDEEVSLVVPRPDPKRPEEPSAGGYEPGVGVDAFLDELGGPKGFRGPIVSAVASWISIHGSKANVEPLKALIRAAIAHADPGNRATSEIERYSSDRHLDDIIEWVRTLHGDQPPKGAGSQQQRQSGSGQSWRGKLLLNNDREPRACLANAIIALRHAPEWQGVLAFDLFQSKTVIHSKSPRVPWMPGVGGERDWNDVDDIRTTDWLQHEGIMVTPPVVCQAIEAVAHDREFHPVRDYYNQLRWDNNARLDTMLIYYFGVEPDPRERPNDESGAKNWDNQMAYIRAAGSRWMIATVARIFKPGCKVDFALILEGDQGKLKSTALRILAEPWFTDDVAELGSKDCAMQLAGRLILEIGELSSMTRADLDKVKAFMTRTDDRYRPPYGRRLIAQPRQCSFAGTSNRRDYLTDETGGRRWLPVWCSKIDKDALYHDRDQLWAEAVARFRAGEKWHFDTGEFDGVVEEQQEARRLPDAWEEPIQEWIDKYGKTELTIHEVLREALFVTTDKMDQRVPSGVWLELKVA